MEEILEEGIYCKDCGWFESERDIEQPMCPACGCPRSRHVPAKVIQVGEKI